MMMILLSALTLQCNCDYDKSISTNGSCKSGNGDMIAMIIMLLMIHI